MERQFTFMERKTQGCQDVNASQVYRFNRIPIKILASYFVDIVKQMLKFIQKTQESQHNTEEAQSWRTETSPLQGMLQSYNNQDSVGMKKKKRQIDQGNRIKSSEKDPHQQSQPIFDKRKDSTTEQRQSLQ